MAAMNFTSKSSSQSWEKLADQFGLKDTDSDNKDGQCSQKTKNVNHTCMKLPKKDMNLYGHLPIFDDFTLLKCPMCSLNIRHQYFFAHIERCRGTSNLLEEHQEVINQLYKIHPSTTSNSYSSNLVHTSETSKSAKNAMFKSQSPSYDNHNSSTASRTKSSSGRLRSKKKSSLEAVGKRLLPHAEVINIKTLPSSHLELPSPQQPPPRSLQTTSRIKTNVNLSEFPNIHTSYNYNESEFNPDKHCGVNISQTGKLCTEMLNCSHHSSTLKQAVPGRSKNYSELLHELSRNSNYMAAGANSNLNITPKLPSKSSQSSDYNTSVSNKIGVTPNCIEVKPKQSVQPQLKSAKNQHSKKHKSNNINLLAKNLAERQSKNKAKEETSFLSSMLLTTPSATTTSSSGPVTGLTPVPSTTNLGPVNNFAPQVQVKVESSSSVSKASRPMSPILPQLKSKKQPALRDFKPQLNRMSNGFHNFVLSDDNTSDSEDDVKVDIKADRPIINRYPKPSVISTSNLRQVSKDVFTHDRKLDKARLSLISMKDKVLVRPKSAQSEKKVCDKPTMPVSTGSPEATIPLTSQHAFMTTTLIPSLTSTSVCYEMVSEPSQSSTHVIGVPVTNYHTGFVGKHDVSYSRSREKAQKRRRTNSDLPNGTITHNFIEQQVWNPLAYTMPGDYGQFTNQQDLIATITNSPIIGVAPEHLSMYINSTGPINGQIPQHTIVIDNDCSGALDLVTAPSSGPKFLQSDDMHSSGSSYIYSPTESLNMSIAFAGSPTNLLSVPPAHRGIITSPASSPMPSISPTPSNQTIYPFKNGIFQPLSEFGHPKETNISLVGPQSYLLSPPGRGPAASQSQAETVLQLVESDDSGVQKFTSLPVQATVDASHNMFQISLPLTLAMQETESSVLPSPSELNREEMTQDSQQRLFSSSSARQPKKTRITRILPKEMPQLMQTVCANGQLLQIPADILCKNGIMNKESFL